MNDKMWDLDKSFRSTNGVLIPYGQENREETEEIVKSAVVKGFRENKNKPKNGLGNREHESEGQGTFGIHFQHAENLI